MELKIETILNQLSDEQVVTFELSEDKKSLRIEEACDYCYFMNFSKDETLQLVEELKGLINLMEE